MKFKITTANNFIGRFKRCLNVLYKQRNTILRERPQLNEFVYFSSPIYREKLRKLWRANKAFVTQHVVLSINNKKKTKKVLRRCI